MDIPHLILNRGEERRIKAGHLWIFSNEVDTAKSPLTSFEPGQEVKIASSQGKVLGMGYVNPRSLIAARLVSRTPGDHLDGAMLAKRLTEAKTLREMIFKRPYYRLVFGEGDYLPGLVVDRYDDILVVQITTAGMERLKPAIAQVLAEQLKPRAILLKNDAQVRTLEGLDLYTETLLGQVPDEAQVEEGGTRFTAPLAGGQKTGWFFDQRGNRAGFRRYASGARVLDVFSYVGGFGIQAAMAKAAQVICVDASQPAAGYVLANAKLNGLSQVETQTGEADTIMEELHARGERFGLISLDPPAFIKRKKDQEAGARAYQRHNRLALSLLSPGGVLATSSCSQHFPLEELRLSVLRAGNELGLRLQIIEHGHQSSDHPIHPAMPETEYLKALFVRVAG